MTKLLNAFFVFLGAIFLLLLLAIGYIYMTNMFGVRALFSKDTEPSLQTETVQEVDKNPLISPKQEKALEAIGVNPAKLPTVITAEMSICFDGKLGKERTQEIKNGSSPTATEFLKVQSCL